MPLVLGQSLPGEKPALPKGFESWEQYKALFFSVVGYDIYTPEALAFHKSNATCRVATAPARTGKSYTAAFDCAPYAYVTEPSRDALIWSIGPTYRTNKEFDYLHDIFVNGRERLHAAGFPYELEKWTNNPNSGDMEIRFVKEKDEHGRRYRTRILGLSSSNEETLQGEQVTYAIMSEAAEHPEHIYRKYLQSRCWRIVLPTTPKQKATWLRDLWQRGRDNPEIGVDAFHFGPHQDPKGMRWCQNPTYDWQLFDEAKAAALVRVRQEIGPHATEEDDPYFAEQFLGLWKHYTGRVLPFARKRHIVEPGTFGALRGMRVAVSVDYGYEDPAVALFWAILPGPTYFIFDEIYQKGLTSEAFVDLIQSRLAGHGLEAEFFVADPSRPEVDRVMQDAGLPVYVMDKNAQRDRAAGYRRLIDLLSQGAFEKFPGIFLSTHCPRTASEWEEIHYKDNFRSEYSEGAIEGADHAADAARYFLMTRSAPRKQREDNSTAIQRFIRERQQDRRSNCSNFFREQIGARRYAA